VHATPILVTPHGTGAHLHPSDRPFGGVIRPRDLGFPVEGDITAPLLTQADQQIMQLVDRAQVTPLYVTESLSRAFSKILLANLLC